MFLTSPLIEHFWVCGHENQVIILGQVRFGLHPAKLLPKHVSKDGVFGVMKAEIEVDESMHLPLLHLRLKDVPVGVGNSLKSIIRS
jgi:hypothetical protein